MHIAAHILPAVLALYRGYGAIATNGNIAPEYAYDGYDLSMPDRRAFGYTLNKADEVLKSVWLGSTGWECDS